MEIKNRLVVLLLKQKARHSPVRPAQKYIYTQLPISHAPTNINKLNYEIIIAVMAKDYSVKIIAGLV